MKPAGSELRTYSAVFPGTEYDEAWKVRRLGRRLGIEPGTFELAPRGSLWLNFEYLRRWQEPLGGDGAIVDATMVAMAAADGVEVVLDGQTGDELFGCSPG